MQTLALLQEGGAGHDLLHETGTSMARPVVVMPETMESMAAAHRRLVVAVLKTMGTEVVAVEEAQTTVSDLRHVAIRARSATWHRSRVKDGSNMTRPYRREPSVC